MDPQHTFPGTALGEALGVEHHLGAIAKQMRRLVDGGERTAPVKVEGDPPFVALAGESEFLERVEDFDAVRADLLVHAIRTEGIGHADRVLEIATADAGERISDAEVRILAEAGDEEDLAAAIVSVQVAPVVEVAIAGCRIRQ